MHRLRTFCQPGFLLFVAFLVASSIPLKAQCTGLTGATPAPFSTISYPYTGTASDMFSFTFSVTCPWGVSASQPWITFLSPTSGTDTNGAQVQFKVAANTGGARTGTINVFINGNFAYSLTVSEAAAPTLSALPSPLNFGTYVIGGTVPSPQAISVTSTNPSSGLSFTTSFGADCAFLTLMPSSGSTPAGISASINTAGATVGNHTCIITFMASGVSPSPTVTATLTVPPPTLSVSVPSLSFGTYSIGGTIPSPQSIGLTSVGPSSGLSYSTNYSSDCAFLTLSQPQGTTPASVRVTINTAGATLGSHSCTLTFTASGVSSPPTVTVTLTVSPPAAPTLSALPSLLQFGTYTIGTAAPQPLNIGVTSTNPTSGLAFSTSLGSDCAWLTLLPTGGNTPLGLGASVNTTTIAAGSHSCTITFNATGVSPSPTVTATVNAVTKSLSATPSTLSFGNYTVGGTAPAAQPISVSSQNPSSGVAFTASLGTGCSWLNLPTTSGNTPANLNASVNTASLANITQTTQLSCTITFSATGVSPSPTVLATLTAFPATSSQATLSATPPVLPFGTYTIGTPVPSPQNITVASLPNNGISFSSMLGADCAWLTLMPSSGTTQATLVASVNAAGVTPGQHSCVITFSSAGASNSPTVTATLTAQQCTYSLASSSTNVGPGASTGSVQVMAPSGCPYSASAPSGSFASITGGASGSGNGTVSYSVQANSGAARSTALTIAGQPYTINQLTGCVFGLTPQGRMFPAAGGSDTITVGGASSACQFTVITDPNAPWLLVNSTTSTTVAYTALANVSTSSRTGTLTVAGQPFTVVEAGNAPCTFSLTDTNKAFTADGGTGSTTVTTAAGCSWTASVTDSNPFVTITGGSSGTGEGMVSYVVQPNTTGANRLQNLRIANNPYVANQTGTSALTCTASVPSATQVAVEGRTEVLGDLLVSCSGLTLSVVADISLMVNTNVTNALSGSTIDATLTVSGTGISQRGTVIGYNTIDWSGVALVPGSGGTATLRISNVRADASQLGTPASLQSVPVTGQVNVSTATGLVPVMNGLQTMANAAPTLVFSQGATTTNGAQTTIPLKYQEATATGFHATAPATRLHLMVSGVPSTVQVQAPVFPLEGARAQLYSANPDGSGGAPVGGVGGYQTLTVTGGVATATWVVTADDPTQLETDTFPLILGNAGPGELNQITLDATLAPVSQVSVASATAPVPRFRDFSLTQNLVNLRASATAQATSGSSSVALADHARIVLHPNAATVGSKVQFTNTVVNDNQSTSATNVVVGSKVTGGTITSCTASTGTCTPSTSGTDAIVSNVNLGVTAGTNTVSVVVTVTPTSCGSSTCTVENDVTSSSDQPTADLAASSASAVFVVGGTGTGQLVASGGAIQSARVGTAFASPLQVTLKDASGNPVANQTVTFVVAPASSGASATLSSGTAATNSAGVAQVTATANGVAGGPYSVTASNGSLSASFSLTNLSAMNGNDVAQGKPASQSSTLAGTPPASVAVDGLTDGNFNDGSVTATNLDPNPWWQVDLGSSVPISSIVVWNRTDCCGSRLSDYWVFVSNSPFNSTDTPATLAGNVIFSSHQTSAPSPSASIPVGVQGRYVRIQLSGPNYLSLAEVQVLSGTDLAAGMAATQSSTLAGTPPASVAVDGNTDGNFNDGSVTATNLDPAPWWQVDLGSPMSISSIVIWNRTDCCGSRLSDYWVFVSNTPFSPTDTPGTLSGNVVFSSHQTSAPNPSTSIPVGVQGRYVRVQIGSPNYLSLAEVQVIGGSGPPSATDVAQGKAATQSSTLAGTPSPGVAVDGNTDGNFNDGSVTATNLDPNAWWQVDLGSSASISSIVIWNRTDCCASRLGDYWVFVSDTPFLSTDTPATLQFRTGTFASHQTSAPSPSATIPGPIQGRYVRIQLTNAGYLSLAEVQVFGTAGSAPVRVASQSSTLPGTPPASVAIDGNTDGNFNDGSVTATNSDPSAWWQVDLGATTTVNSVTIWNRTDCCGSRLGDYWVFVSNTPFLATDTPGTLQSRAGTQSSHQTAAPNPSVTIPFGVQGRYIRVQLTGTNYLSLAEVQVQ